MTQLPNRFMLLKTTVILALLFGVILIACSKDSTPPPPPPDKTALEAKVDVAQDLYDITAEGTKPGNYEVGSRTALNVILDAAKAVLADAAATQADITNATAQLEAAMVLYATHFIKEIASENLIGFWKFNGNAVDSSENANDGAVTAGHAFYGAGTPVLTEDRFGRAGMAYHFDKGGNIEVPYTSSLNPQEMSISLWCNWSSAGRTVNIDTYTFLAMNRWNGYKFQLQGGHLPFYTVKVVKAVGDTTIHDRDDAGVALTEDTWYHVVVTFKADEMKFYIDGDLVTTWPTPLGDGPVPGNALSLSANPTNFVIGQDLPTSKYLTVDGDYQVAWGGFFTGDMDDVMFYNVALEGPQVKSINTNQKTL